MSVDVWKQKKAFACKAADHLRCSDVLQEIKLLVKGLVYSLTLRAVCTSIQLYKMQIALHVEAFLHAIYGTCVFITIVQCVPPQNVSSVTNYSILTAMFWNHSASVSVLWFCTNMCVFLLIIRQLIETVSQCIFVSTCPFMYTSSLPLNAHILSFIR